MNLVNFFSESFEKSAQNIGRLSRDRILTENVCKSAEMIIRSYEQGGGLFIAGNGGSAADAQHIAAEMVGKLSKDRNPLKAYALTVDSSYLTAVGNDYGYDHIFSRQIEGLMSEKDVFLGITTSGNSTNLIEAFKMARQKKVPSILLTGKDGGKIAESGNSDLVLIAPGNTTAEIQEAHIVIYHALCFSVEFALVEKGIVSYRPG